MRKAISISSYHAVIIYLFNFLFFLAPLMFYARTSEVFEFNKMVFTYTITVLISGFWIIRMVTERKIIFRRTILDLPLLAFLLAQLVSTLLSIDPRTSWLGYYSRFNGGLVSNISYCLLYWAFVSNFDQVSLKSAVNYWLIPAALIVSVYGILEHFGGSISCLLLTGKFDDACWVQDVATRVFATLGQPNWMAAYLVAILPIIWSNILEHINDKEKFKKFFWIICSAIVFWAVIYTKSRSGLIAVAISSAVFGFLTLLRNKYSFKKILSPILVIGIIILAAVAVSGTPWTPSVPDLIERKTNSQTEAKLNATSEGGTESGDIRKIVWQGAINIWKAYPIFGTGPETFAFTYYMYRPVSHNLVSEWDFLYNKAHNEFLNYLANTGAVGFISYLTLIGFSIYVLRKSPSYLAGYAGILITNFFGFSVVITQIILFLLPAMAIAQKLKNQETKKPALGKAGKLAIGLMVLLMLYLTSVIYNYWRADVLYARAKAEIELTMIPESVRDLNSAIKKVPDEPLYHDKLAQVYAAVAVAASKEKDTKTADQLAKVSISEISSALDMAPKNFVILQDKVNIYSDLSPIDQSYLLESIKTLEYLTTYAPNYAKIYYKLGTLYSAINQKDKARQNIEKAINLKPNYEEAKKALILL